MTILSLARLPLRRDCHFRCLFGSDVSPLFAAGAPFRALQVNRAIMRQPSAPASQAGGYCRRDSAGRSWLSPAQYRSSAQSDRPARFAGHRTRARREPEPCSSGGSRSPALSIEPLAKLLTEYGLRHVFARDGVISGSVLWLSLPIWSIFPDAKRVDAVAVAAAVRF